MIGPNEIERWIELLPFEKEEAIMRVRQGWGRQNLRVRKSEMVVVSKTINRGLVME